MNCFITRHGFDSSCVLAVFVNPLAKEVGHGVFFLLPVYLSIKGKRCFFARLIRGCQTEILTIPL